MKPVLPIFWIMIALCSCNGQTESVNPAQHRQLLKEQAEITAKSLIDKDYETFVRYCHPNIISQFGGKDKLIGVFTKNEDQVHILDFTIGDPSSITTVGDELQATVPQTIVLKVEGGRLVSKSTLLAFSFDHGSNWVFLDASNKPIEALRIVVPNISPQLTIPEWSEPTFYPD